MATIKQKKLAKEIVNNLESPKTLTGGQMLEKVGYSQHLQKQPGRIMESEGVQEELQIMGFSEEAAKGVVSSIMHHSENDMARLKASDQMFKVLDSYAPDKLITVDATPTKESTKEEVDIVLKAEEDLKKLYGGK